MEVCNLICLQGVYNSWKYWKSPGILFLLLENFITNSVEQIQDVYNSWKYWKFLGISLLLLEKFITQSYTLLSVCCWYYV